MTPDPDLLALTAGAILGGAAGWALQRNLDTLGYRRDHERHLPHPRHHQALPVLLALGAGILAHHAATGQWTRAVLALPVLLLGGWLAAVDADVQRLPYRQVAALTALETLAVLTVGLATQDAGPALTGAAGGLLTYLGFRLLHRVSRQGIGYGDVTLAGPLGAATAAAGGLPLTWWWLIVALTAAAIFGLLTRQHGRRPLGPWLIASALINMGW